MLSVGEFLMNFCTIPDLAQEEAAIDKKAFRVDDKYAALEVQAEMNGEMYVPQLYFVIFAHYCHHRF